MSPETKKLSQETWPFLQIGLLFTIKVQFRKVVWSGFSVLLSTFQNKAPWGDGCDVENDFGLFLSAGKWAYEVLISSQGLMQIGWCTLSCRFNQEVYTHLDDEPCKGLDTAHVVGKQSCLFICEKSERKKCCRFILQTYAVSVTGSIKTAEMNPEAQSWAAWKTGTAVKNWLSFCFCLFFLLSLFSHKVQYCCYEGGNDLHTPNSLCIRM